MPLRAVPVFGSATSYLFGHARRLWVDLALLAALGGILFGLTRLAAEWTGALRPVFEIDLSPWALPYYAFLSLSRGLAAYALSLLFTIAYGYWAARDRVAERLLVPALDILQSIPVLGFMPGLVLALVAAFPRSNVGLELASVIMIFTGQAWNMTFSFYHSLKSVPPDLEEVARLGRFGFWRRFRWLDLPASAIGLVWNSMMSMAGGWFFLMVSEAFVLGDRSFQLPGLGSYMSVAVARGDRGAMVAAVVAMVVMIVLLDQVLWRPVVVWAQRFRMDEGGQAAEMQSWFLDLLRSSRIVTALREAVARAIRRRTAGPEAAPRPVRGPGSGRASRIASLGTFVALLA
ncbi:MAG TPA: ABC transporter permease subunit, partial [Anaeromyxobacteraceae bacterium]|nr:ABC transporter permease subunit [Anaeromyxobacteraceae bacterium]